MTNLGLNDQELIDEYYERIYENVHYRGTLGWFTSKYHHELENNTGISGKDFLDIGGGSGEHLSFVKAIPETYTILDPNASIGKQAQEFAHNNGIRIVAVQGQGEKIPFEDNVFDRVVITCVLLHAVDPVKMIREACRVLRPGGTLSIYLPSDPGMLYRFTRHLTSHRRIRKLSGFSKEQVKYITSLEHVNHAGGLIFQIRHVLGDTNLKEVRFPIGIPGWNFNLFRVYHFHK
jgi:phosphatidylethanolamine/phosphatidyl-N-methylethanolamine N-methyltransferase